MTRFSKFRERARRKLHEVHALPAFYYADGDTNVDPVPITVRVHTQFGELGDIKGTSYAYAEREAEIPKLRFWNAEIKPRRTAVVVVAEKEAYRLDSVEPPYRETTDANVTRLSVSEAEDFDFPPDTDAPVPDVTP